MELVSDIKEQVDKTNSKGHYCLSWLLKMIYCGKIPIRIGMNCKHFS
jgi:hypothetical protein